MNHKKSILLLVLSSAVLLIVLFSCRKYTLVITNQSGQRLENIIIKVEKNGTHLSLVKTLHHKNVESVKISGFDLPAGDGSFILEYYIPESHKYISKRFGYYTSRTMDCENQMLIIKQNKLIEKCR